MFKLFPIPESDLKKSDLAAMFILENEKFWNTKFRKVVEFGCAKMRLIQSLRQLDTIEQIVAVDIDEATLFKYLKRVKPLITDNLKERQCQLSVEVYKGDMRYSVKEVQNMDVVIALNVIQELKSEDIEKVSANIFDFIQPKLVIISTPNADNLSDGLEPWAAKICEAYANYSFAISKIGLVSQIAVFARNDVINQSLAKLLQLTKKPNDDPAVQYKLLYDIKYPFVIDERSNDKKVQHKISEYLRNVFRANDFYDEELCVYRIRKNPLIEYGKTIGVVEEEIDIQLNLQKFTVNKDIFIVNENYMVDKFGRITELNEELFDYVPYRGNYMTKETNEEVAVSRACDVDEDEENWD